MSTHTLTSTTGDAIHKIEEAKELVTEQSNDNETIIEVQKESQVDGKEAWKVATGAWCALFCTFGWVNAVGVFQDYYQSNQLRDFSPSSISWILSLEPFVLFLAGLLVGKLFDNFGPRWLLLAGTLLHIFGVMMISISSEFYQFILAQGVCSPLGMSFIFYPTMASTATWFKEKKGLAFGVVASGSSLGGVIFPAILPKLLPSVGFGWSIRICGFIMLAMLIAANVLIKSRIQPTPRATKIQDYYGPFTERAFLLLVVASTFGFFALFIPINYVILQAQTEGISPSIASYLLSILNAGSMPGRILPGYLGDKLGRFNVMISMCVLSLLSILLLWLPGTLLAPRSPSVYIIFSILYGFASGAFVGLVPALLVQISPDLSKIGTRQGVLFTCLAVASLVGSPIAGAILSNQGGAFWGLQVFAGVMMVASTIFYIVTRIVLVGPALRARA